MQCTGAEHTASARLGVRLCVFVCDSSFIPDFPSCTADSDSAAKQWRTGSELARLPPPTNHPYISSCPIDIQLNIIEDREKNKLKELE